jgi:MGT family glycosyltransferase
VAGSRTIVVLEAGGSHTQRLLPLIAGFASRGHTVHVLARAVMRDEVELAGGIFFDLFGRYPVEAVDTTSLPVPSRLVSFAAAYAEPLIAEVAALRPALLVYDSFMVVGPLIGRRLAIPYVSIRSGHAQAPARAIAETAADGRAALSAQCLAAVETLRREHGMAEANPFSYLDGLSPYLNLYPEPAQFLDAHTRAALEPIAFFGCLAPELRDALSHERPLRGHGRSAGVYVSFGTIIWRYYAALATAALATLAEVFSAAGAEVLISLGKYPRDDRVRQAIGQLPHVRVERYVDQWGTLRDADLFVTHHGLNSTHEAVFQQVPMLSYPFFGDQPAMARRCHDLGLAAPLSDGLRAPLQAEAVRRAFDHVMANRQTFAPRLAEVRQWELDVIAAREDVLDRMLALA